MVQSAYCHANFTFNQFSMITVELQIFYMLLVQDVWEYSRGKTEHWGRLDSRKRARKVVLIFRSTESVKTVPVYQLIYDVI